MRERSRTEYSLLNIFVGIGGYALNTILGFICRMVFVRYLSADYLGVSGLFTNILTMLSLAELGVGSAVVYALYKPLAEHDEEKIASLVRLYGKAYRTIGIVIAVIGIFLMPFLNLIIKEQPDIKESIYLLYFINLFNTSSTYFFSYRSSLLSAAQQNYIVIGVNYIVTIVQSILQMIWLPLTHNYLGYLLIQTVGTFIYNITVSFIAVRKYPYIKKKDVRPLPQKETKELFRNVRDLMIYKISGLLVNSTDNILITFFRGLATTGIASNYTMLVSTLNSLLNQIFNGINASVGNHNALETNEKRHEMFQFLDLINFWIFGWAALGIYFCSSDIISLFFGKEYVLSNDIPFIMALNFYLAGATNMVGMYKHTMGLFHYGRFIQVVTGILNIILSIILGNCWGLFGIFAATAISRICTHVWYTPYVVYTYGFKMKPTLYTKKHCKYFLVLLIAAALCRIVFQHINGSAVIYIISKILVCSIIANIVFIVSFFNSKELKKMKRYVFAFFIR